MGRGRGYQFGLETQGSIARDWFADLSVLTLSPKPPSSDMVCDPAALDACIAAAGDARTVLKFVVFDDRDYDFAREVAGRYPTLPVYLQPGNHTPPPPDDEDAAVDMTGIMERMRWLVDKTVADQWFAATVLPQLHVLLWGNLRGV